MPLHRKIPVAPIAPTNNTPLPATNTVFHTQAPHNGLLGGLHASGNIKFSLQSTILVGLARAAFQTYSIYKSTPGAEDLYLRCLETTSAFEGGFDSLNSYDDAGVSVGFIQFARPETNVGKLLELVGHPELAAELKTKFGTADPHSSPAAMIARHDTALMTRLVLAVTGEAGIKAQFGMSINQAPQDQKYFDKAYARMLELHLTDPMCMQMLFDAAVNMGAGSPAHFPAPAPGATDGDWLKASAARFTRPERKTGWLALITKTFA